MPLDVVDVDGVADSRPLIEIEHVTLQVRIIDDATKIAYLKYKSTSPLYNDNKQQWQFSVDLLLKMSKIK